jgi:hypothetical protein
MFKSENFEIHCLRDNRWMIETSIGSQKEAEEFARKQLEKKDVLGVKVVRERKGSSGGISEMVVFTKTKEKKEEKVMVAPVDQAPMCEESEDCYGTASRMVLNRLFRQYLDKQNITPMEVMHNYREFKRLQDLDSLMTSVIGMLATLQAQGGGMNATERRDTLYKFLKEMSDRVREIESTPLPSIKQLGADETLRKIALKAGEDKDNAEFLFRAAVSRDLIDIRNFVGKLDRALMWADDSQDEGAAQLLDDFVCDVLGAAEVIQELLGDQPNLFAAISRLLDLAEGKWDAPPPGAAPANADGAKTEAAKTAAEAEEDRAIKIGRLIVAGKLPNTARALMERVRLQLTGVSPLMRSKPEEKVPSFRTLIDRLIPETGKIVGGTDMVEALVQRKSRILNKGGAAGFRAAAGWMAMVMLNPARKARYCIALTQTASGKQYPNEAYGLIDDLFVKVESIADIAKARVPPNERMAAITLVWNEFRAAPIQLDYVERVCGRLDDLLVHYIKSERILEKIDDPARPLRMRTMMLMKLCMPASLPPGKASNLARATIVEKLKRPNFEGEVVADIADANEKAKAQRDIFMLMRQAGFM